MKFYIFMPENMDKNDLCRPAFAQYKQIAEIEADRMEDIPLICTFRREMSTGDIIQSEEDMKTKSCHILKGKGFEKISSFWLRYKDWNYMKRINALEETSIAPVVVNDPIDNRLRAM